MKLDASKPIKSVNLNGTDAPLDIFNIAYGTTPPADVTRLWIPLEQRPDNVEISGDSLQNAVDAIETKLATLASSAGFASAVPIDSKVYVFGGYGEDNAVKTIQEYNTITDTIITKNAALPENRNMTSAVAINGKAYIFGGGPSNIGAKYNSILEYDPSADSIITKNATFPNQISKTSAVVIGGKAYIFGGDTSSSSAVSPRREIYEYDPVADVLVEKNASLPESRCATSAVAINGKAYIFGGKGSQGANTDTIYEYDPMTDAVNTMTSTFPKTTYGTAAVAINGKAYIFGGSGGIGGLDAIYEYDPLTDTIVAMKSVLNDGIFNTSAVVVDVTAYVLGGSTSTTKHTNSIQAFTPKAYLGANHLKIFASVYRGEEYQLVTNIVNNKNVQVKLFMTSAFIGDEDGYAKEQDAYVFNKEKQQWQALDGTSMTTDMLNALAELGVT